MYNNTQQEIYFYTKVIDQVVNSCMLHMIFLQHLEAILLLTILWDFRFIVSCMREQYIDIVSALSNFAYTWKMHFYEPHFMHFNKDKLKLGRELTTKITFNLKGKFIIIYYLMYNKINKISWLKNCKHSMHIENVS